MTKKIIVLVLFFSLLTMLHVKVKAIDIVVLGISEIHPHNVDVGENISVTLYYSGNVAGVSLPEGAISANNFVYDRLEIISVSEDTPQSAVRLLTFYNVRPKNHGDKCSITVTGGTAASTVGMVANPVTSRTFEIFSSMYLEISMPSSMMVYNGSSIYFDLIYTGSMPSVVPISDLKDYIRLTGFDADKEVKVLGTDAPGKVVRRITLSNIKGHFWADSKTIDIIEGSIVSSSGIEANSVISESFKTMPYFFGTTILPILGVIGAIIVAISSIISFIVNFFELIKILKDKIEEKKIKKN